MDNIYLIVTDSYRLMSDEIKGIVNDNKYISFDMSYNTIDELLEEISYFSLFDDEKFVVVKNANIFNSKKKSNDEDKTSKDEDKLLLYLDDPNPKVTLIFGVYDKIDGKKKICKLIKDKYHYIEKINLSYKDISSLANDYLRKYKYKISSDTLYYIYSNSLSKFDLVMGELDKIMLYYNHPCQIELSDVKNIMATNLEESNFKFIDSLMAKDIKSCFKIYDDLMMQKVQPVMLIAMIAKEIRNTLLALMLRDKVSKNDLMKELDLHYDFQINKVLNNSFRYKKKELEDYLVQLYNYDLKIKTGKINAKRAGELIILMICN